MEKQSTLIKSISSFATMSLFFFQMIIAFIYWRISYHQWRAMDSTGVLYYGFPFKFDIYRLEMGDVFEFLGYLFLNLLVYYIIAVVIVYIYKKIKK